MLLLLGSLLACRGTPLAPALQKPLGPIYPVAQQGCARFQVEVRGRETITVDDDSAFVTASGGACGGVRPVLAGAPVYDGPADRVRLPLALANQTAQPFRAPARLYGWEDSLTVLEAPGLAQNQWTADYLNFLNPDSALAADAPHLPGAVLWRYDTLLAVQPPQDELAAGDTSQIRWVELAVHSGVLRFQLVLYAEASDADTSRPAVPPLGIFPRDTTIVIAPPGDTMNVFYRNIFVIRFDDTTSGRTIRSLFQRYGAEIISGGPAQQEYFVRVPDPGASWEAYEALKRRLNDDESGVDYAAPVHRRSGITFHSQHPVDGIGAQRSDWVTPTDVTRPRLAIRAPLAWGCETGTYTSGRVGIGVIDFHFDPSKDLSSATLSGPSSIPLMFAPSYYRTEVGLRHGTQVASILAADGNNGEGIAGMIWGANLQLLAYGLGDSIPEDLTGYLVLELFPTAAARGIRVLQSSAAVGSTDPEELERMKKALYDYLAAGNLIVQSVDNNGRDFTIDEILAARGDNLGLLQALITPFQSGAPPEIARFRDQIMFVAGTNMQGQKWANSNLFLGATAIAAPAEAVGASFRVEGC